MKASRGGRRKQWKRSSAIFPNFEIPKRPEISCLRHFYLANMNQSDIVITDIDQSPFYLMILS